LALALTRGDIAFSEGRRQVLTMQRTPFS